jgi:ribonuclease Z
MLTEVTLSGVFAVHELLHEGANASVGCGEGDLHANEAAGMDIMADGDGVWRSVLDEGAGPNKKGWSVQAGPIEHRGE